MPGCGASNSTSAPGGQPPPGSSADSAAWPVGTPRPALRANCVARERAGWMCSGDNMANLNLYCTNIQYLSFHGPNQYEPRRPSWSESISAESGAVGAGRGAARWAAGQSARADLGRLDAPEPAARAP